MIQRKCSACGRILNKAISPNEQDPCLICDPEEKDQKAVDGVGPVTVVKEDATQRTPEAVEAKKAEKAAKAVKVAKVEKVQSDQCAGKVKKTGNQCKNKPVGRSKFCKVHKR